jgi:uncharacterized protein YdaT
MFTTFSDMRKEANEFIKDYREDFIKIVLNKNGIVYYPNEISKREFHELMEKYDTEITKNEKLNRDEVHIKGELVAYWSKDIELVFVAGNLNCKIKYWLK